MNMGEMSRIYQYKQKAKLVPLAKEIAAQVLLFPIYPG